MMMMSGAIGRPGGHSLRSLRHAGGRGGFAYPTEARLLLGSSAWYDTTPDPARNVGGHSRVRRELSALIQQPLEYVGIAVINGPPVSGIARASRIAGISRVADVAVISQVFIDNHVLVQLADVRPAKFMNMGAVDLTDSGAAHRVNVPPFDESDGVSPGVIKIIRHRITFSWRKWLHAAHSATVIIATIGQIDGSTGPRASTEAIRPRVEAIIGFCLRFRV